MAQVLSLLILVFKKCRPEGGAKQHLVIPARESLAISMRVWVRFRPNSPAARGRGWRATKIAGGAIAKDLGLGDWDGRRDEGQG